jgi:hypothetical protein
MIVPDIRTELPLLALRVTGAAVVLMGTASTGMMIWA